MRGPERRLAWEESFRGRQWDLAMRLTDDAGHEVGVHSAHCSTIDVRDLEERVGAAARTAFGVDHLANPAATLMRFHQHRVTNANLQKDQVER